MISSLALFSTNQPTTKGKHQNTGAELQYLSDVVDFKAGQEFEGRNDQGDDDYLGQFLLQAIK